MQQIKLMSKFGLALIAITAISVVMATHAYYIQAADAQARLPNNSVRSENIVNGQVLTQDIGDGTIQEQDIADGVIPDGGGGGGIHDIHTVVGPSVTGTQSDAICPEGEIATGGGFATNSGRVVTRVPLDDNGWRVITDVEQPLAAYVRCGVPSP